ncbi:MAG: integrase arm-type DNA-binding domain-containing protein [Pseudomonadota bacterium]
MSIGTQISRNAIEKLMLDARIQGKQLELSDIREPGLRIRAGQRAVTWWLNCRLQNGKRTRIKLGQWPGMGIRDARHEARRKRAEILDGMNPNEQRRVAAIELEREARSRRTVSSVLDEYDERHLSTLKRGKATRRALDGPRGLLHDLRNSDIGSPNAMDISQALRESQKRAPIAANRNLAYARAFFNWCKAEQIISDNPAADIRKPARERSRDRVHSVEEIKEIWNASGELGYPFASLVRLLIVIPMKREEVASIRLSELEFDGGVA